MQFLRDRLRLGPVKAREAHDVRLRLVRQPSRLFVRPAERATADKLRMLRERAAMAFGRTVACATCGAGRALPHGAYDGGFCCGATTAEIFSDEELGALRLSGTTPWHLVPAPGGPAGCAFRGPKGCVLLPAHRPNQCVRHLCYDLVVELGRSGRLAMVEDLTEEIFETFLVFTRLRQERIDDELLGLAP